MRVPKLQGRAGMTSVIFNILCASFSLSFLSLYLSLFHTARFSWSHSSHFSDNLSLSLSSRARLPESAVFVSFPLIIIFAPSVFFEFQFASLTITSFRFPNRKQRSRGENSSARYGCISTSAAQGLIHDRNFSPQPPLFFCRLSDLFQFSWFYVHSNTSMTQHLTLY